MQTNKDIAVEERAGGEVWITVERPHKHNALARRVLTELGLAVLAAGARTDTRFIVLTGAGDRFFAAGGDLVELAEVRDEAAAIDMAEQSRAALDAVRNCPVPVLAYLNGDAIGGGAELALACDLRILASHAHIGFIQARLAISSVWGGGVDLCQLAGGARAMRMMGRGELIDAPLALDWGLADAIVSDGPAGADMQAFLKPLRLCAPQVLRAIKAQAAAWRQGASYEARRAVERQHAIGTWLHEDHWRASDAFLARGAK